MPTLRLSVNGKEQVEEDIEPSTPLLWVLRDSLGLVGTKFGCGGGFCGACTVHVDGAPVRSCSTTAASVVGRAITTIEGLASDGELHPLQEGFWEEHGLQCGFCTPGMIMASHDLLQKNPNPSELEIREGIAGNLCRCTGYHNIVKAVQYAAKKGSQ